MGCGRLWVTAGQFGAVQAIWETEIVWVMGGYGLLPVWVMSGSTV